MRGRLSFAGLVVAVAIAAAACGSGSGNAAVSIKTLRAAASNAQAAGSTSFDVTMQISAKGRQVDMHGTGVMTSDGKEGTLTLSVGDLGSLEERVTADGFYMDFGGISRLASELPDGKRWVFFSYEAMREAAGADLRSLVDQSQSSNPNQGLEYLQATSGDVTKVGDDTVGGAHATHYRTTIDYAQFAEEKLGSAKPEIRRRIADLGKVPADVWIDDSDRVVKTQFAIDASAFGATSGSAEMTMEITGFGVPVDVQAPPADETVDVFSLQGQSV